jgi:hypothetical protein
LASFFDLSCYAFCFGRQYSEAAEAAIKALDSAVGWPFPSGGVPQLGVQEELPAVLGWQWVLAREPSALQVDYVDPVWVPLDTVGAPVEPAGGVAEGSLDFDDSGSVSASSSLDEPA